MVIQPDSSEAKAINALIEKPLAREYHATDLLRRPDLDYDTLHRIIGVGPSSVTTAVAEQVEIQLKYAGYIERQQEEIDKQQRQEKSQIPEKIDYDQVKGLSHEVRQKFSEIRPETVGMAARIPGVTPAAISLLLVHMKKGLHEY